MTRMLLATALLAGAAAISPAAAQTGYGYQNGYSQPGYSQNGYYQNGYGQNGYGYQNGYDRSGNRNGYDRYGYDDEWSGSNGFDTRLNQIELRVQDGVTAGTIDRREAWRLRSQLNDLRRLEQRYSYNGMSASERTDLQQRLRSLRQDVRIADGRRGDDRYGYDDGRYDQRSNGYYGQGGPYEEANACYTGSTYLCLRVGDRASSGLYGVPSDYRDRYRDGSGFYYRSDGRAIYRIDSRTNRVVDVYDMDR